MKLAIAIVHERDKQLVADSLLKAGHKFTIIASTGGFLKDGKTTFLIGAYENKIDDIVQVLRKCCGVHEEYVNQPAPDVMGAAGVAINPVKVIAGGAIIFIVDVEDFIRV
ncbi:MAG: cyclic-di-AMP receptor [Armatimonadota bacterium]